MAQTFAVLAPVQLLLHKLSCSNEMIPNAPKHYEPDQNMGLGSNGVDRVRSLWKIPTRLRGTNFCINCTSSARFAPSFMQQQNDPKCTQTIWNRQKHELRLQWGGFAPSFMQQRNNPKCTQTLRNAWKHEFRVLSDETGALVANNSDTISWHELLR